MTAMLELCEEETLGYEYEERSSETPVKERRRVATMRQMTGEERASRHARYSRRSAPKRQSGAHRRGNKRHGI